MSENTTSEISEEFTGEEDTIGDYHRLAAYHFDACAKHHHAAATADDDGDEETAARHAYLAYRHQLSGVQYAEIAAMESESLGDEFESSDKPGQPHTD